MKKKLVIASVLFNLSQANAQVEPLFSIRDPLDIKLTISIKDIKKSKEDSTYRSYVLHYKNKDDQYDSVDAKLKGRGNFRLKECFFPPLWLKISKHDAKETPFAHNRKLKLVLPCQNAKQNELIVKEYLCYKIYEIISGYSFKTRMVNVALTEMRGKNGRTFNIRGILIEDMSDLVRRAHSKERKYLKLLPGALQDTGAVQLYLFEYLIGNTDWSTVFQHNTKAIETARQEFISVPYDFDMSGMVDAPYAVVSEVDGKQLPISNVRERYYRGYCRSKDVTAYVRNKFIEKENDIMLVPGTAKDLLSEREIENMTEYLKDFFDFIKDESRFEAVIGEGCLK